jgi:hypothetical protein
MADRLIGLGDQAVAPHLLVIMLWVRPLANSQIADPEPGFRTCISARRVEDRGLWLQPEGQAAPQLSVAQPAGRSPRELAGRHRLEPA